MQKLRKFNFNVHLILFCALNFFRSANFFIALHFINLYSLIALLCLLIWVNWVEILRIVWILSQIWGKKFIKNMENNKSLKSCVKSKSYPCRGSNGTLKGQTLPKILNPALDL